MSTPLSPEEAERQSKKRQIESGLFSLEADRSHLLRKQALLVTTLHGLRHALHDQEVRIANEEAALQALSSRILEIESTIAHEKKRLHFL